MAVAELVLGRLPLSATQAPLGLDTERRVLRGHGPLRLRRTLAHRQDTAGPTSRPALGHDPEDRVVAADAGAALLVVLLGVADLEELGLRATHRGP